MMTKTIVMTGVTRGLGRALAREFVVGGHTVYGCGRSRAHLDSLAAELGAPHDFQAVDVRDEVAVEGWRDAVLEAAAGPPDLLINNAAVIHPNAKLWEISGEDFKTVLEVNLAGVANVLRAFLPGMVARASGVVVNLSSGAGRMGLPNIAGYCTSKWGIEGMTRSLAEELPPGMAAVPLSPGMVDTDMLRSTLGGGAASHQSPEAWARRAAPFILGLGPGDNGRPLEVPGEGAR